MTTTPTTPAAAETTTQATPNPTPRRDRSGRGFALLAGMVFGAGLTMMVAAQAQQPASQPTSVLPAEPVDQYFVTQANTDGSQVHLWVLPKDSQAPGRRAQIELVGTFQAVARGRR